LSAVGVTGLLQSADDLYLDWRITNDYANAVIFIQIIMAPAPARFEDVNLAKLDFGPILKTKIQHITTAIRQDSQSTA